MSRSRSIYARWFINLILFWLVANLAGFVRPMGLKPFGHTGFPFTIAAWGFGIEEFFDWKAFALNVLIAAATSAIVAGLCVLSRRNTAGSR